MSQSGTSATSTPPPEMELVVTEPPEPPTPDTEDAASDLKGQSPSASSALLGVGNNESIMGGGFLTSEPSGSNYVLGAADGIAEDSMRGAMTMSMSVNMTSEQARLKELSTVFNLFDTAGRGFISVEDLPVVLKSLGISKEYLSIEVYESIKAALDPKRIGLIRFDAYLQIVGPCMPQAGSFEEQFRVFRMMDRGKKGYLDMDDLMTVGNVECTGLLSEKQCAFIMGQLKTTTRPGLTFDEFKRAVATQMHLFE
jgi:Ca2+-binding EF-hand superfamily protein